MSRCLAVRRAASEAAESGINYEVIDRAIGQIRKDIGVLNDVSRMAGTVRENGDSIRKKAEQLRNGVIAQLEALESEYLKIKDLHARES